MEKRPFTISAAKDSVVGILDFILIFFMTLIGIEPSSRSSRANTSKSTAKLGGWSTQPKGSTTKINKNVHGFGGDAGSCNVDAGMGGG